MKYQLIIDKDVFEYLAKLPKNVRVRIRKKIDALADNPKPSGFIAMQGQFKGLLRIRVGDYRVIYKVIDDLLIVTVLKVGSRGGIYR